ncbi:splicing factor 3A subunit 2-like [Anopheles cruzii]|uniref:splicing factor 3A subunit 2-like n=1 Tax=Anopheles cruzii TaxID=68878 RepID=UPI0022EC2816|nr:splicing factor 3A subunit 2-like [Anopheles cruzii]
MQFLVVIAAVSALVGVCSADGYGKPVYPSHPVSHAYAAKAPHVKCGSNLLVGCAPHVAHVPCHPSHGGYHHAPAPAYHAPAPAYHAPAKKEYHAPAPAYHAPAPAYHAPAPAYHAPAPAYHAPAAHGYEAPKKEAHYEAPKKEYGHSHGGYEAPKKEYGHGHGYEAPKPAAHGYGGYGKRSSDFEGAAEMED